MIGSLCVGGGGGLHGVHMVRRWQSMVDWD